MSPTLTAALKGNPSFFVSGAAEALVIAGEGKDRVWSEWSKIVIEGCRGDRETGRQGRHRE
jgi:predicted oxidoreductase (fatty acid repression mutant protein)